MAKLTDLTDLLGVINAVKGTEQTRKTSGGTTKKTSQTNVSDQGVTQLIDQILAGPGGVKSVGSAARSSGMFDSTVEDTQLAELYSSAANKAELARTPTTTTTTTPGITETVSAPGVGAGGLLGTLATTSAVSSLMKGEVPFTGLFESMGGGGAKSLGGAKGIGDAIGSILGGGGGSGAAIPGGFTTQIAGSAGLGTAGGVSSTAINASNAVSGAGAGAGAGGFFSRVPGGASTALGGAGGFLSGLTQEEEALGSPESLLATLGPAALAGGPMGAAAAAVGSILGSALSGGSIQDTVANIPIIGGVLDDVIGGVRSGLSSVADAFGTVICTALMYKGHLDKEEYRLALRLMHTLHPTALRGYHYWAVGVANKIKKGHKGWTAFWKPIMQSRVKLLASGGGFLNHCKYPLGTGTKYILEPGCYLIGRVLELHDTPVAGEYTGEHTGEHTGAKV